MSNDEKRPLSEIVRMPGLTTAALAVCVLINSFILIGAIAYGQTALASLLVGSWGILAWTFLAREAWWVLLPITVSFSGFVYFGFKIPLHELGVILCLLPLAVTLAVYKTSRVRRPPIPTAARWLLLYLFAHLLVSTYILHTYHSGGLGHVTRTYVRAIWPLLFFFPFYWFGTTNVIRIAFLGMYCSALLRVGLTVTQVFIPNLYFIPGINLVLPGSVLGLRDLRTSALLLAAMSLGLFSMATTRHRKVLFLILFFGTGVLILLGGGRGAFVMFCTLPLILAILRGRFMTMSAVGLAFLMMLMLLNRDPLILYRLPDTARRTLSILILNQPHQDVDPEVSPSNDWHFGLAAMGRKRWTASVPAFLVGNRVQPYNTIFASRLLSMQGKMEIAAGSGAYESGLWTVLAVLGITGFVLYALLFSKLLPPLVGEVRRNGIRDYNHAFYFLAISSTCNWVLFCWIAGHFPSSELLFSGIAFAAYCDASSASRDKQREERT